MTGLKRLSRQAIGCIVSLVLVAAAGTMALAEEPTRFDVLYGDSLEPVELEANVLDLNLPERLVIVGEQIVLLVEEEEAQPPVRRTILYNRAGNKVGLQALKVRQRVLVKGLQHPSGQIVALEIQILKNADKSRLDKKRQG